MKSPKKRAQRNDVSPWSMAGGRRCIRGAMLSTASVRVAHVLDQKNSPSRLRFRPPFPGTFALRLLPSGAASTYSRSVLGARGNLERRAACDKGSRERFHAICEDFLERRPK